MGQSRWTSNQTCASSIIIGSWQNWWKQFESVPTDMPTPSHLPTLYLLQIHPWQCSRRHWVAWPRCPQTYGHRPSQILFPPGRYTRSRRPQLSWLNRGLEVYISAWFSLWGLKSFPEYCAGSTFGSCVCIPARLTCVNQWIHAFWDLKSGHPWKFSNKTWKGLDLWSSQ